VPALDAVATHDPDSGDVTVFVVNRALTSPATLSVSVTGFGRTLRVAESWTLSDADLTATNTAENPDRVVPRPSAKAEVTDGSLRAELPPVSWTAIRLLRT
jgi:alpha-N-arabinofuranosidase